MEFFEPSRFRAPFIERETIQSEADKFRAAHWPSDEIPVDIFEIAECELDLEIRPIEDLKSECDIDSLLLRDRKTLLVDGRQFIEERFQNRIRFSVAHEIGHLVLHSDIYPEIAPTTVEEWIEIIDAIPESQYRWIENHANEFAGRLLVPRHHLLSRLQDAVDRAESLGMDRADLNSDSARDSVATYIYRDFQVSPDVISRRLRFEGLWPPG